MANLPDKSLPAPALSDWMTVRPEWIDFNGHLNMAYYNVLFDEGVDDVYHLMGFGAEYARTRGMTTFVADFRVRYLRELHEGDRVQCSLQLLAHDEKRFHSWQELRHEDGWLAATAEGLTLHVDMSGPRVAPMPPDVKKQVAALQAAHDALPRPEGVGLPIGIPAKA
ncbi:acyl-CoA thioester hydrolase [Roseovarius nanhaiticus]|uniref:Acyl-CoA thioester hydrolase n=1 Tax=Roseovarius nanhaiticus TaxID=573024 RepID=A0A1N7G2F1_9RHOB|nr:acyl-CoA thioester hydrolase [Roseovarius nanhaiticus]SIS06715.1 acyl-CoA thioester hydrolase [Roseovarius nanhaiticus]